MRRCWLTSGCGTAERVDEFVHAARRLAQLQHDRDPHRRGQRAQQIAGGVEDLARRQVRQRRAAVLVAVVGRRQPRREVETVFIMAPEYMRDRACQRLRGSLSRECGTASQPSLRCSPVASIIDTVANLAKRRGLVYQSGEIYGGTKSAWDYGPLGVELKENIKRQWWRSVVTGRDDVVGLDSAIILPREVWVASGHVEVFNDPLVECLNCHKRHRQDHLQEAYAAKKAAIARSRIRADDRDRLPGLRHQGPVDRAARLQHDAQDLPRPDRDRGGPALSAARDRAGHLRQLRQRGDDVAQEAAVRHRPDRQELPQRDHAGQLHLPHPRVRADGDGVLRRAGDRRRSGTSTGSTPGCSGTSTSASTRDNLRLYEHPKEKLSHYSDRTVDIEYKFGFQGNPWGELEGVANRTDFDLSTHSKHSGVDLSFYDQATDTRYVPYVIEPAAGLTRSLMAFLVDAYTEDEAPNAKGGVDKRTVLRLDPRLAPVKAAVLPLSRNADLSPKARDLAAELRKSGTSSSTTPARSAGATAARTRSARRSA